MSGETAGAFRLQRGVSPPRFGCPASRPGSRQLGLPRDRRRDPPGPSGSSPAPRSGRRRSGCGPGRACRPRKRDGRHGPAMPTGGPVKIRRFISHCTAPDPEPVRAMSSVAKKLREGWPNSRPSKRCRVVVNRASAMLLGTSSACVIGVLQRDGLNKVAVHQSDAAQHELTGLTGGTGRSSASTTRASRPGIGVPTQPVPTVSS